MIPLEKGINNMLAIEHWIPAIVIAVVLCGIGIIILRRVNKHTSGILRMLERHTSEVKDDVTTLRNDLDKGWTNLHKRLSDAEIKLGDK